MFQQIISEYPKVCQDLTRKRKCPDYPNSIKEELDWLIVLCGEYWKANGYQQSKLRSLISNMEVAYELTSLPQTMIKKSTLTQADLEICLAALIIVDQKTGIDFGYSLMKLCKTAILHKLPLVDTLQKSVMKASKEKPDKLPYSTRQILINAKNSYEEIICKNTKSL
jgi:hypothetical protein